MTISLLEECVHPRIRLDEKLLATMRDERRLGDPADPAPAASVVLIRDAATEPEVHLQMRAATMAFAGGRPVFPGGGIDAGDDDQVANWIGPPARRWAADLGTDPIRAHAIVCGAVRETFEESGYLLASPIDGSSLSMIDTDDWREDRDCLSQRAISLAELLARRGLALRTDWMKPLSVWITPEFEPRRFHTWFFLARCPQEQQVLGVSRESTTSRWITASQALRLADSGELQLLPPQYCTFLQLYGRRDTDEIFSTQNPVPTVRPTVAEDAAGTYLSLPEELVELGVATGRLMYGTTEGQR
jgi:8-oxo-dGTP pyrophosphatase MutT (NUDIX family)